MQSSSSKETVARNKGLAKIFSLLENLEQRVTQFRVPIPPAVHFSSGGNDLSPKKLDQGHSFIRKQAKSVGDDNPYKRVIVANEQRSQSEIRVRKTETQQDLEISVEHPTAIELTEGSQSPAEQYIATKDIQQNNRALKSTSQSAICERLNASTSTFKKEIHPRILHSRCLFRLRKFKSITIKQLNRNLRQKSTGSIKKRFQDKKRLLSKAKVMSIVPVYYASLSPKKMAEKIEYQDAGVIQAKALASIYRAKVIDAYRNRRIFTVFGNYGTIRRALLKRGWLEKLSPSRYLKLQNLPEEVLLQHAKRGNEYETVAISKIINHYPAFFVWQPKGQRDLYADVQPYRNRIRRAQVLDFSTKVGLIGCAEQQQWYRQEGVAGMLYPRFFRLDGNLEEKVEFVDDFRMTQCRSFLRYLTTNVDTPEDIIDYENGSIPIAVVRFAIGRAKRQIDEWENIVSLDTEQTDIPDTEWNDFITNSSNVINFCHKLKCTYRELVEFTRSASMLLAKLEERRPDYKWDGYKNLWILKPGYQSRGLGIIIRNNLDDILRWSSSHSNRRYIVQKYIEQPLLIYNTKFDIRQYMLVFIRESTVQVWLYKDCYLRFSSHEYSIDDLREVIHLTNNSVQKKYKNKSTRDPRLPKNNMWSLDQFKVYMKTANLSDDLWETRVFAGFRENLIAVVMASLDETNMCENCFELYGCDFMLDESYHPIMIEINSTPDLSASTDVTARICPLVMQDCIKVIVDLPRNGRALTGLFQMVYEVNYKFKQDSNSADGLNVNGKSIQLCVRARMPVKPKLFKKGKKNEAVVSKPPIRVTGTQKFASSVRCRKSKTSLALNVGQTLKTATKEALALRYTMPT